jgi:hypothetical protein
MKMKIDKASFANMIKVMEKYKEQSENLSKIGISVWNPVMNNLEAYYLITLKVIMNDTGDLIRYFCYTLNFGKNWKPGCYLGRGGKDISLKDSNDLWTALVGENE